MDRRFMSNMMASFHQAKPVDPHSVVVVKKPAKTSSKVDATPSTSQQMVVGTKAKDGEVIKKKKKKPPSGTLSVVEAVIAKRKRKEERKRLKEAAAARGQRPETSQESVVGRTTSAPETVILPAVQRLPESQTPNYLAPNPPAIRKKPKKPKKDKRSNVEPLRAVEVPVVQAVGPEIIEILDTDDEDFRPTPLVSHPSRAPIIQVSSLDAVASSLSKKKEEKVSS